MMRMVKSLAILAAATAAMPASADDWGETSSGSLMITVVIAPFGAAVAAAQEGAVGAWSVNGLNDGVMLGAPDAVTKGGTENISLFNNANAPLSLTSARAGVTIGSVSNADFRGLRRQDFSVSVNKTESADPVLVVVGSI